MKYIYLIRNGISTHDFNFLKYGPSTYFDPNFIDTQLTSKGHSQCTKLLTSWDDITNIDIILVSPLHRALETANILFTNTNVSIICLEDLREYPNTGLTYNKRKSKDILSKYFPNIDFTYISNNDHIWNWDDIEEDISVKTRVDNIINLLKSINKKHICLISDIYILKKLYETIYPNKTLSHLDYCYPCKFNL